MLQLINETLIVIPYLFQWVFHYSKNLWNSIFFWHETMFFYFFECPKHLQILFWDGLLVFKLEKSSSFCWVRIMLHLNNQVFIFTQPLLHDQDTTQSQFLSGVLLV